MEIISNALLTQVLLKDSRTILVGWTPMLCTTKQRANGTATARILVDVIHKVGVDLQPTFLFQAQPSE